MRLKVILRERIRIEKHKRESEGVKRMEWK